VLEVVDIDILPVLFYQEVNGGVEELECRHDCLPATDMRGKQYKSFPLSEDFEKLLAGRKCMGQGPVTSDAYRGPVDEGLAEVIVEAPAVKGHDVRRISLNLFVRYGYVLSRIEGLQRV
jgi:hypothetical protein